MLGRSFHEDDLLQSARTTAPPLREERGTGSKAIRGGGALASGAGSTHGYFFCVGEKEANSYDQTPTGTWTADGGLNFEERISREKQKRVLLFSPVSVEWVRIPKRQWTTTTPSAAMSSRATHGHFCGGG